MTLKIILDANFLFIPSQFRLDIFEGISNLVNQRFEPILLSTTHEELKKMAEKRKPKLMKQAVIALKLAEKCRIVDVEKNLGETNDDAIIRVAAAWKCPVATNDRELRRKLRAQKITVIFLRGKSRLQLEGAL